MESILESVKKMLGMTDEYEYFDADLIMHINSVFYILNQMGIGPAAPFVITDANDEWSDFLDDKTNMEAIKTYVFLKVRMIFDPPTSSSVSDAANKMITELEWRLNLTAETSN